MTSGDAVESLSWYHTIDLPGGVTTAGWFDLRPIIPKLPIPESLAGMRCLDVGSCDGFYAFEMERRGAAEVVGIDLDDPADKDWPGDAPAAGSTPDVNRSRRTFRAARELLGSSVERKNLSVYDLTPEAVGTFDFAIMGSLLLHLQDAVGALRAVRSVVTGRLLSVDTIDLPMTVMHPRTPAGRLARTDQTRWWTPNAAAHRQWVRGAGWRIVDAGGPVFVPLGAGHSRGKFRLPRNRQQLVFVAFRRPFGVPHQWVLASNEG
jgi:tRNA (mo5U34)-methyltransferase